MQTIARTSITRSWHWGIVAVFDKAAEGDLPEFVPDSLASVNQSGLVVRIRHAQDVEDFDESFAEATITVSFHAEPVEPAQGRHFVCTGKLSTPGGTLSVGDADMDVVVPAVTGVTNILVSVADPDDRSPEHIWLDIWPESGQ